MHFLLTPVQKFSLSTAEVCKPGKETYISKKWIDVEDYIPEFIWKAIKKDTLMKFYNKKEQVYPQTDTSIVSLGAGALQTMDRMWFQKKQAPDISEPWPIEFASKCLTNTETWYNNIEREPFIDWRNSTSNILLMRLAW